MQHTDPSPQHDDARDLREEGTGNWVLGCRKWNDWLNLKTRCLWIYGNKGTGKTVLAAYLIDQVSQMCERQGDQKVNCVYYYCSHKRNPDDAIPFLRWLVSQLCRQKNDVPDLVFKLFESGTVPGLQQLLTILHALLADLSHLFVVIEAVEQSNRRRNLLDPEDVGIPRRSLLKVIRTLMTDVRFAKVQLLITSCPNEDIEAIMFDISDISDSISMANIGVEEDVKLYVKARLRSEPRLLDWPKSLRDDAERYLCQSVKRGFRWVDDTLDGLLLCSLGGLEDDIGYLRDEFLEWTSAPNAEG